MHEFQKEAPNMPDWEMINYDEYTRKEEERDVRSLSRPSQRRTSEEVDALVRAAHTKPQSAEVKTEENAYCKLEKIASMQPAPSPTTYCHVKWYRTTCTTPLVASILDTHHQSHSPSRARVDIYALFHDIALVNGRFAPDDEALMQEGGEEGWHLWQGETGDWNARNHSSEFALREAHAHNTVSLQVYMHRSVPFIRSPGKTFPNDFLRRCGEVLKVRGTDSSKEMGDKREGVPWGAWQEGTEPGSVAYRSRLRVPRALRKPLSLLERRRREATVEPSSLRCGCGSQGEVPRNPQYLWASGFRTPSEKAQMAAESPPHFSFTRQR
ncbi:hypothetical protein DFH09DRAFT_1081435 [Mycena vulgaris]|nr:hypothetical protein DFH09DRAFT_1096444 [Mycena vulgaris]KAJ6565777.1 hypothetical protein DFH09DRAFT_1081435 [Mycena vulgaris]